MTPTSANAWRIAAERALNGATVESLVTRTLDGLTIEPLYGPGPSARTSPLTRAAGGGWDIRARIDRAEPAVVNDLVLEALQGGASSVLIEAPASLQTLMRTLQGVAPEAATIALDAGLNGPQAAKLSLIHI